MNIGILGGGQLARMMAIAGYPLGHRFVVFDPAEDACAGDLCEHIQAAYEDEAALDRFAQRVDLITLDFENVPVETVRYLKQSRPVYPDDRALEVAQDRLTEKDYLTSLGIGCAPYRAIEDRDQLIEALTEFGYPSVLKTRRMGYDGKGQAVIRDESAVDEAWASLSGQALILEQFIEFDREVSMISARSPSGDVALYPLTENRHKDGILMTSFAPALGEELLEDASRVILRLMESLDYVGILTVEFFVCQNKLVANEIAPRVHNSGHWTIDAGVCSQFENHIRAITDWPLGSTEMTGAAAMLNWIGTLPDPSSALSYKNAHWHNYGKKPRPGRKVGHVTLSADSPLGLQAEIAGFMLALSQQLQQSGSDTFLNP